MKITNLIKKKKTSISLFLQVPLIVHRDDPPLEFNPRWSPRILFAASTSSRTPTRLRGTIAAVVISLGLRAQPSRRSARHPSAARSAIFGRARPARDKERRRAADRSVRWTLLRGAHLEWSVDCTRFRRARAQLVIDSHFRHRSASSELCEICQGHTVIAKISCRYMLPTAIGCPRVRFGGKKGFFLFTVLFIFILYEFSRNLKEFKQV